MARRRSKASKEGSGSANWLVTFSDMMTLLLTFFVLLLSMAALRNERKQHLALGSIAETFGMGRHNLSVLGKEPSKDMLDPGPFQDSKDLAPLKNRLWEEKRKDIEFISNKFVQVISIQASVLFGRGEAALKPEGRELLRSLVPELQGLDFPVLLAGHTAALEGEAVPGGSWMASSGAGPSWGLSLARVLRVYSFLAENGVSRRRLKLEAFGRYHPRYGNTSREGRSKNRRVDIVLDKRNFYDHSPNKLKDYPGPPSKQPDDFRFKGFRFDLGSTDDGVP